MKYAVRIICGPEVAAGFALAGLSSLVVGDATDAQARLRECMQQSQVGLILIEERLLEAVPATLRQQLARTPVPMIIPFPSPVWKPPRERAEAYVVELLRRAVGYRVRLR